MSWYYQNQLITELPEDCVGFVYCITNTTTGRMYIGKKLAKFSKTTYKTIKLKNGTKKKKKIRSIPQRDTLLLQIKSRVQLHRGKRTIHKASAGIRRVLQRSDQRSRPRLTY
jgi:hypothetical protein